MDGAGTLAALRAPNTKLGLIDGQVRIVGYQPLWGELGDELAALIRHTLARYQAEVQHVGSTAVPGLAAKPILDLAVGIPVEFRVADIVAELESVGVTYRTNLGALGGLLFAVVVDEPARTLAHVHVVSVDDSQWAWYQLFRDGLRNDAQLRHSYTELKRSAASEFAADRESYTQAKFDWVREALSQLSGSNRPLAY